MPAGLRMKRRFILGLGAQKTGTKWLRNYLLDTGDFEHGGLWEAHVWDALTVPALARFRLPDPGPDGADSPVTRVVPESVDGPSPAERRVRWHLQQSADAYFEFYRSLCEDTGSSMAGDITPSYSALSSATLSTIDQHAARYGFDLIPVFVMRDPVERCWSAFRMEAKKTNMTWADLREGTTEAFLQFAADPATELRTRYDHTLQSIEASVGKNRSAIAVFEELFTGEGLAALTNQLGIPCRNEAVMEPAHVSSVLPRPDDETWEAVARLYEPVYRYVGETLPAVRKAWGGYSYL